MPARTRQTTPTVGEAFRARLPAIAWPWSSGTAQPEWRSARPSLIESPRITRVATASADTSRRLLPRGFRVHSLQRVSAQRFWPRDVRGDDRNTTGSACLTRYGERWECTSTPLSREFAPGPPIPCGKAIVASFRRSLSTKRCGHRHRPRRSRPEPDVPVYLEERQDAAGACPRWRMMRVPWRRPEPWCSRHWRLPDSRSRSSCRPSSAASDRFSASGLSTSSFAGEWRHRGADELPCRSALPKRPDSRTESVIIHS